MNIETIAYGMVILAGTYLLVGLLFCLILFIKGIAKLDPNAGETGIGFKVLVVPGVIALWPLLWIRWNRNKKP